MLDFLTVVSTGSSIAFAEVCWTLLHFSLHVVDNEVSLLDGVIAF